jgi:regulator of RNase E activity RraB
MGHVVTVRATTLPGNRIEFKTLPNGDIIVEDEKGDGDLAPLAEAVEGHLDPPYWAIASRQDGDVWAVGARRIQVAEFELAEGDAIELIVNDGAEEVRVDGEPSDAQVPELVQLGERKGASYCVEAERIDGDFWEVQVNAL